MDTITKTEWRNLHRDYKMVKDGQRYMLKWIDGKGTCLVPVQVVKDPQQDASC